MNDLASSNTTLSYLDDAYLTESRARVLSILQPEGKGTAVILDKTIFYPQGGGQPADHGLITGLNTVFCVNDVRLLDGVVYHFGTFSEGGFSVHEEVALHVDGSRRLLHARLHSAGHLVDAAVTLLRLPLKPIKGYHFPQGPYVEYEGEIPVAEREKVRLELEKKVNELVESKTEAQIIYADRQELEKLCPSIPDYLVADEGIRIVELVPGLACPCGGTHVKNTAETGYVSLTKIRVKSGQCRISYSMA